jgi:hypothetical protein
VSGDQEIDVRLTVHEARALAGCANLMTEALIGREDRAQDARPRASETAAMKLETAVLQAEGCVR